MGAWDFGVFDNDDALDWIGDFEEHGLAAIERVFGAVTQADYIEAPDASEALAAAEVVAAVQGRPAAQLPDNLRTAIDQHKDAIAGAAELKAEARKVVQLVLTDSELKELWAEGESAEAQENLRKWQATLSDLAARLE